MMPTERPVPPAARNRRSSTRTSRTPSDVRWKAMAAPVTPPPMTMTSAARLTPASVRQRRAARSDPSQAHLQADGALPRPIVREPGGGEVLQGPADGLEERDLLGPRAPRADPADQLGQLGDDMLAPDRALAERDQEVAGLLPGARVRVHGHARPAHGLRVDLTRVAPERADGVHVDTGAEVDTRHHRRRRRGRARDDVRSGDGAPRVGRDLHGDAELPLELGAERVRAPGVAADDTHALERQNRRQAAQLEPGLHAGAEAREPARVRPRRVTGGGGRGGAGPAPGGG